MFQHVAHNERKVFLSHNLLFIAKFGDTLGYTASLLRSEFKSEFLKILGDVSLAAILAQGILALSSESLWHQGVAIQIILLVAIGMHTSHLGKHIVADNRLVRRNGYTTIALHHTRDVIQLILADVCAGIELVLQNHLNAG